MDLLKPRRLRPGDTVAVVSASWGGPSIYPATFEAGLRTLREVFGLQVLEMPTARRPADELQRDPRARADDLNAAFADPQVRGIISSIGGDDSVRILPWLDPALARADPKVLLGYSDTSTQTGFYHHVAGLVTYNGPSVMAGFAQLQRFPAAVDHVRAMLFDPPETLTYQPFPQWTNDYPTWADPANADRVGELRPATGPHWLQGDRRAEGRLYGGCADVLEMVKGTPWWPGPDFWDGRVLFLETSEDKPPVAYLRYWLRNYGAQGVFDRAAALLVGRARDYTDDEKRELDEAIVGVVAGEFGSTAMPVVTNCDFGHTDPQWVLPLGCRVAVDPADRTITLLEPATA